MGESKNINLNKAKRDKNDEFYTQYVDIEKEIDAYLDFEPNLFKDKTVLLPCDDPTWSNISFLTKYNPEQFEILGISQRGCHDLVPDIKKYNDYVEMRQNGEKTGSSGGKTNENPNLAMNDGKKNYFINKDGHTVQSLYSRIFIRHKK